MQEPMVDFYFVTPSEDASAGRDDSDGAPGLVTLPAALLQRHGARVLNPEDAVAIPGLPADQPPVRPTVYRARTLLVPSEVLGKQQVVAAVNVALARVGMSLTPTDGPDYQELERVNPELAAALEALPRVAVLSPVRDDHETPHPRVVDAWVALQTLREAAALEQQEPDRPEVDRDQAPLAEADIDQFGLEHVMIGSAIAGSPAHGGGGGLSASPSDSGGGTGPGPTDSYTFFSGDTRIPVAVCLDAPERRDCTPELGRRPVVAVLDTGIRAHPWLDVEPDGNGGYLTDQSHGFVTIDKGIQDAICAEGENAETLGDRPRQVIRHAWDKPVTADPLIGELDSDTGHCTFISGIVRQVAPEARVLAIRIMHGDGIVNEGDLLCALGQLANRVGLAQAADGDMGNMVDVASLSLGYFSEAGDAALTSGLKTAIGILLGLGVTVVAAAGNYSTSRKFYPAALARSPALAGPVPLVSVGALNPNRAQAVFSDGGRWITAWACGAIMISTFPVDVQGSQGPGIRTRMPAGSAPDGLPCERAALAPDDYRGGWAAWSGTSFSAPLVAAHLVRELLKTGLRLDLKGKDCARERALTALKNLGWP